MVFTPIIELFWTPVQHRIMCSRQIHESKTIEGKNIIKMDTKTKQVERFEQTELFISTWEAEPSLWDIISTAYKGRTVKMRSLKNLAEKFP